MLDTYIYYGTISAARSTMHRYVDEPSAHSCANNYKCRSPHSRAAYLFLEVKLQLFGWKSRATDGAVLSITVCTLAFASFTENFP
jgi:hypothetical protein